jgi:hypothetical protein
MAKIFVDDAPTINVVGGMVHVAQSDGREEVWPIGAFTAHVNAGMRAIRDFQSAVAKPVPLKRRRAAH